MSKSTDYDKKSLYKRIMKLSHGQSQDEWLINLNFTRLQFLEVKDKLSALKELIGMVAVTGMNVDSTTMRMMKDWVEDLTQQSVNELQREQLPLFYWNTLSKKIVEYDVAAGDLSLSIYQDLTIQDILKYHKENGNIIVFITGNYIPNSRELIEQIFQGLAIAEFIKDKFNDDNVTTIPLNEYYKLRAYDQFKDKDLLKSIMTEYLDLDVNTALNSVNNFIKDNFFSLSGICKAAVCITGVEEVDHHITNYLSIELHGHVNESNLDQ
ncbi:hypothetical protein Trichorick_00034 [Candidatus Trichorickettsia mobilis]|uniref:Uncharacterized protein n=1 Tax=Candidatus Trichorickettsia mobilis TaxID=1346319 RepID=A0ABZ0UVV8_9RICK|nr:hypothetical protein [Candidatus Trichorickettsia mobilis]WPY00164.1 hypothetical protein Trichorick_00034 [Candidatus Trichorickettsia mobilis]